MHCTLSLSQQACFFYHSLRAASVGCRADSLTWNAHSCLYQGYFYAYSTSLNEPLGLQCMTSSLDFQWHPDSSYYPYLFFQLSPSLPSLLRPCPWITHPRPWTMSTSSFTSILKHSVVLSPNLESFTSSLSSLFYLRQPSRNHFKLTFLAQITAFLLPFLALSSSSPITVTYLCADG